MRPHHHRRLHQVCRVGGHYRQRSRHRGGSAVRKVVLPVWNSLEIVTDKGKEFCNRLNDELMELMGTKHLTTTPYHPQCNSQAEVFNKKIASYLSLFVDDTTLDWEVFLAPLMFSYNTSFHRSTPTEVLQQQRPARTDTKTPVGPTGSSSQRQKCNATNGGKFQSTRTATQYPAWAIGAAARKLFPSYKRQDSHEIFRPPLNYSSERRENGGTQTQIRKTNHCQRRSA